MIKENLVFVHSFPTNSRALKGLIDYLNSYFNVIPIDLPGFVKEAPALQTISLKSYSDYVDRKVLELDLERFYMGGQALVLKS